VLATFLVLPVLVIEGGQAPAAIRRSAANLPDAF
jgi:hypothetical protein